MASAGWDEVLGSGAGDGGDPPDRVDGADGGDGGEGDGDDEAPEKKKRVKTSTKIVLVAAGWVLLTLFLVGQFSADKAQPSAVARLDTVSGEDGAADEALDEEFEPEPVDTEEEEALDVDGDGFLSAEEQGIVEGEASASLDGSGGASSGEGGSSGSSGGGTSGGGSSGGESGGGNAVPGAAPATTTTARAGSGTTTTTSGGGGGGGGTTSTPTTKPGGGGSTSTTSSTTSTSTTSGPPPPQPVNITVKSIGDNTYEYPANYSSALVLPAGSTITFDNTHLGTRHSFTVKRSNNTEFWDTGRIRSIDPNETSPELTAGTYTFACTNDTQTMGGTITVS